MDKSWWTSAYSPPSFLKLNYVKQTNKITGQYLRSCCASDILSYETNERQFGEYALLFCYFNDRNAFNEYVRAYDGKLIIIIGPEACSGTVTDPLPLKPQFEFNSEYRWSIETIVNIDNFNYIGIYKKCFK